MRLSEYILLSQEERMRHVDLSAPCDLIRMNGSWTKYKGVMVGFLGLENDIPLWRGKVDRCHACENDTQKPHVCINPLHIYIGTPLENLSDRPPEKAAAGGLSQKGLKRDENFCRQNRERLFKPVDVSRPNTGEFMRMKSQKLTSFILGISQAAVSGRCKSGRPTKDGILLVTVTN